jgi:hypothetical protein
MHWAAIAYLQILGSKQTTKQLLVMQHVIGGSSFLLESTSCPFAFRCFGSEGTNYMLATKYMFADVPPSLPALLVSSPLQIMGLEGLFHEEAQNQISSRFQGLSEALPGVLLET